MTIKANDNIMFRTYYVYYIIFKSPLFV